VQVQPQQKVHKLPHLNQWLGAVVLACHPQLFREAQIGGLLSRKAQHKARSHFKNNLHQRGEGGVAQAVACMPSKCEILKNTMLPEGSQTQKAT
jgi:hypothetical protein